MSRHRTACSTKSILTTRRAMVCMPAIGKSVRGRDWLARLSPFLSPSPHRFFAYSGRVFLFSSVRPSPPFVFLPSFGIKESCLSPPSCPAGQRPTDNVARNTKRGLPPVASAMGNITQPYLNPLCIKQGGDSSK